MKKFLFSSFFISLIITVNAQGIPDAVKKKIDSIFGQWNFPNSPGGVIGVIRNDSLIYSKGYGMANLEYSIPNSPETIYHMASVSKQFTAYSILLLANAGKLSLEDDIRKYLPWFPDLHEKITIRHLMNHTSGIRDQWQLLAISGTRLDDVITQDQIINSHEAAGPQFETRRKILFQQRIYHAGRNCKICIRQNTETVH
jgi:CubicO group peptidase (beta-lactamase class C family)